VSSGQHDPGPSRPGEYRSARRRAGVILAAVAALVVSAGCSTSPTTPKGNGSAASPVPHSAPAPSAASSSVVPLATLAAIALPVPKGVPASGRWRSAPSPTGGSGDGDRLANYVDGNDYWLSVRFLDCNLPAVKATADKPSAERGEFTFCFDGATGKLKDFPLFTTFDTQRAVKAGHLIVIATVGLTGQTKLKVADLEAFLSSLDLGSIAKL
jgi:hypothetical protein